MKIRFIKDWKNYRKGDVLNATFALGNYLVFAGYAEKAE